MTTAIAAHDLIEIDAADRHDDVLLAAARVNAKGCLGDAVVELKPRWRLTEEEIVRASITVILVALMAVISVAAVAILTMG
ncbi:hypothetical protein SKC41_17370 [Mycobacterium sp. 050128]|uniref:hypothetical protein n=1 Tax=Mycobacterium sp. 050128 TaxID=3096112 RepID=UPI002EDB3323